MNQIRYQCNRCEKMVIANVIKKSPKQNKLVCTECKQYIKFIGQTELEGCMIDSDIEDPLHEISFKLDLILDHLGIRSQHD